MSNHTSTVLTGNTYKVIGASHGIGQTLTGSSFGASELAQSVQKKYDIIIFTLNGSAKRRMAEVLEDEITNAWRAAYKLNWDGPGSLPVDLKTMQNAKELIKNFPFDFNFMPTVFPDAKGGIILEWNGEDTSIVTMAIRQGRIVYSALFLDGDRESGIMKFKGIIPKKILKLIAELF